MHDKRPRAFLHEDWLAVWVGLLGISLVLIGVRPESPVMFGVVCLALSAAGIALMGGRPAAYLLGFPVVYLIASLGQIIGRNSQVAAWGLEYVIFSLGLGLIIGNTVTLPSWLKEAVRTEYYIKIGLVIFGAGILFQEILQAGLLGLVQAALVITVVWYGCFWISRKLGVDDEFAVLLSSAVSICGVSAAIAACGAIQGDRRKLSYVSSLPV
jgi:uncharacterized membrane protein YadS